MDRGFPPGSFWLSGSQAFPLMTEVSESLAGRVGILSLLGLSLAEGAGGAEGDLPFRPDRLRPDPPALPLLTLFEFLLRGGMPRLFHDDAPPRESYFASYTQTYIERDVRAAGRIADLAAFQRFLRVAAARVAQLLNVSDIARDVGVAVSTAREWLHLLEATGQVYLLRPYFENIGKRQIKSPKLYFLDTGLVCYLTGWTTPEAASSGAMAGALLENHVVVEIFKSYRHRGREAPLWYYRDKERRKIDLLVAEDGRFFPVEVKLGASPTRADVSTIEALERRGAPIGPGVVVCLAPSRFPLTRSIDAVPVSAIS